ncbi:hypothetical protein D3H55_14440 [Bacillus salacetis]|uniref:Uncharacterized protein n=1 Tax=Bacillus salacetis TaxID=2315464 RepID=A0A3A1QZG1_9BACI|nr:hypothetical protein [Bacillus salacetis]RIW31822.1 hypothetical protein D3H55_14440 [Bacillus salacetis]
MSLFKSPLQKNLIKLKRNLYLAKSDPEFFEKYLLYKDPHSPEAHYYLAKKWEEEGVLMKAYLHYQKACHPDSPHYYQAKSACRSLKILIEHDNSSPYTLAKKKTLQLITIIVSLILLNLLTLLIIL